MVLHEAPEGQSWYIELSKGAPNKYQPKTCRQLVLCLVQPRKQRGLISPPLTAAELQLSLDRLRFQHINTALPAPGGTARVSITGLDLHEKT